MRARSLTPLLVGLFGATALLVVATFALLLTSVIGLRDDNVKARRSSDLLTEASAVERSVLDLETGLRGYLLTRQRRFLEPYRNATARLPRELAALRRLAADAIERRDANQIEVSIRRYLSGYAQPLTGPGIRLSDAQAVTVTTRGKQLVDVLRTRFDTLGRAVLALRTKQRDAANSRTSTAVFAAAFGLTASILLLLALGSYVLRDVLRSIRRVAATARRLAAGDLSARAPEGVAARWRCWGIRST